MTDRHAGFLVTLDRDIREDDAEAIAAALRMVRGVAKVTPVPASPSEFIYVTRRDMAWRERLGELAVNGPDGPA